MNDEQLLIDEMNDFENFMENADVEEIKKEHGLSLVNISSPKFEEGVYSCFNITKISDDSITVYNSHRKSIDLPLYHNDDGYYFFLDGNYISRGSAFDDSANNIYGLLLKEVNSWIISDFSLYPVNGIEPYLDLYYKHNPLVELESFPPFELGSYGNANIVKVTFDCVYITSKHMSGGVSSIPFDLFSDDYGQYIIAYDNMVRNSGLDISSLPFECVDRLENAYRLRFYKTYLNPVVEVVRGEVIESPHDIHQRICNNFDIVEKTLYEICVDLKTIRDNKYYNQLGYDTFENYCQECFNIKRRQAYNYISIAENLSIDFVHSSAQIGVKKLYCLSRLTDEERTELLESTDIEHTPVKEVEKKAKEIKENREVLKPVEPPKDTILDVDIKNNDDKVKTVKLDYSTVEFIYNTVNKLEFSLLSDKFDKNEIIYDLSSISDILVQDFPELYE